nr:putative b3 domain-containing protein [Quercus suber]
MGKGSRASKSKDHEDSATTLEAQNKNKKRKCVVDNGRATSNPKPKENAKPEGLQISLESHMIYAYELPKMPPVPRNIGSLVKNNRCSTPFEKQLQEKELKEYRLYLSKTAVTKLLFPLLRTEELRDNVIRQGIPVTAYDVQGIAFKQSTGKQKRYMLTKGWTRFCNQHGLRAFKNFVTLWMFRHKETDRLCFVISFRTFDYLDHGIKQRPINN